MPLCRLCLLIPIFVCLISPSLAEELLQLDGEFDDWTEADEVAKDPVGDAEGAFDVSSISARLVEKTLWLRFDTGTELNLASGPDSHGTLRLLVELPRWRELSIDFRARQAMLRTSGSASTLTWSQLDFAALPTFAAKEFELRLDLNGLDIREGERLDIQFEGSDELSEPIIIEIPSTPESQFIPLHTTRVGLRDSAIILMESVDEKNSVISTIDGVVLGTAQSIVQHITEQMRIRPTSHVSIIGHGDVPVGAATRLQRLIGDQFPNVTSTFLAARESERKRILSELPRKKPEGAIRIASLNTLHQGTADPKRSEVIRQLFEFVEADVYCFNEEWEEDVFLQNYRHVLPENDQQWHVYWSRSRGIVSSFPLSPVDFECGNGTASIVAMPDGAELAVVSVHLECCGYAGSKEDLKRIGEVTALSQDIERTLKDKPLVVLGDFNLVGSRKPLSILEDAGLEAVLLRSANDGSTITWRGIKADETFWPGRLDYTMTNGNLSVVGGFTMTASDLKGAGDQKDRASDHVAMVIDVSID